MADENLLSGLLRTRRLNRDVSASEWAEHDSGLRRHEDSFDGLLAKQGYGSLRRYIEERKEQGGNVFGVNLAGQGVVLRELGVDGVSVSLEDEADNEMHVKGDIVSKTTWSEIKDKLNGKKVDVVLFRPRFGLKRIINDEKIWDFLANQAWSLIGDGGMILAELVYKTTPDFKPIPRMMEWIAGVEKCRGVEVAWLPEGGMYMAVMIKKVAGAPEVLPGLLG